MAGRHLTFPYLPSNLWANFKYKYTKAVARSLKSEPFGSGLLLCWDSGKCHALCLQSSAHKEWSTTDASYILHTIALKQFCVWMPFSSKWFQRLNWELYLYVIKKDRFLLLDNRAQNSFSPNLLLSAWLNIYPRQITVTTIHSKQTEILSVGSEKTVVPVLMVTIYIHGLCFATEFLKAQAQEDCLSNKWLFL